MKEMAVINIENLDLLWQQAERIGRISVHSSRYDKGYSIGIEFTTPGGSEINARGEHKNIRIALAQALGEARQLGEYA